LENQKLDKKQQLQLRRVLEVMLIGEFFGLHTLNSILTSFGIKSTNLYKIWKDFNFHQIKRLTIDLSIDYFKEAMEKLGNQSDSTWSRSEVTIIIDDSIFKMWLKNMPQGDSYAKFFSGQIKRTVYGFRVTLIGINIGKDFHPLYFQIVPKKGDTKKVALNLLKKVRGIFLELSEKQGFSYPNLYLSVDSGFTYDKLIAYCERHDIGFIGVPKKTNVFKFKDINMNLKTFIEEQFLPKEQAYKEDMQRKGATEKPFVLRMKAHYKAQDREVILLFFRLNGSNKVTVIFCSDLEVMKKTLRRRFFQRTKIELFFRFLKETLKIQKSKSERYGDFVKKLSLCILKAVFCLRLQKFFRKKRKFKGWSFYKIRQHIIYQKVDKTILTDLIY
jgi:hypothetical protein